jgi:hypothetical protein
MLASRKKQRDHCISISLVEHVLIGLEMDEQRA